MSVCVLYTRSDYYEVQKYKYVRVLYKSPTSTVVLWHREVAAK